MWVSFDWNFNARLSIFCASYAPWCPACQQLQSVWKEFADWGEDMGVNIAKVDVTEQPGKACKHLKSRWQLSST